MNINISKLNEIRLPAFAKNTALLSAAAVIATTLVFAPSTAKSESVRIDFSGEIQFLTTFGVLGAPNIDSTFSVGDAVTGAIEYDSAAAPSAALSSFTLDISGLSYSSSSASFSVQNDAMNGSASPVRDAIFIDGAPGVTGPSVGGLAPSRLQFSLGTQVLTTLLNTNLPGAALINALFAVNEFDGNTNFLSFANGETARFSLSSVEARISAVPLPAALPLIVGGMGLLGFAGWRRKKAA